MHVLGGWPKEDSVALSMQISRLCQAETQWASTEGAKCRLPFLQVTGKANVPQVAEGIPTNCAVGVK